MKKKHIIFIISFIIFYSIVFYLALPTLNVQSVGFWFYFGIGAVVVFAYIAFIFRSYFIKKANEKGKTYKKLSKGVNNKFVTTIVSPEFHFDLEHFILDAFVGVFGFIILLSALSGIIGSKMFRAKTYANQLTIETGTTEEFEQIYNYENSEVLLPTIDKDLAFKLAEAKLSDYGAQYQIDYNNFTLLSVNHEGVSHLVRIAPLEYSNLFVSLNRIHKGTIGYIEVDVVSKEANLVIVDEGLKYMPSAKFSKDLERHLRFHCPSSLYYQKYFEIDDEGTPYWVVPTYKNKVSLFSGEDSLGVITCNAVTGEVNKYKLGEEPNWVDRVCVDTLLEKQSTNALKYSNGFINATFGSKKDVFQLSDGYNYFIKDGHTYYVSCITSPNENDQTSIGFITIDLKNKLAKKYLIPGITEMRAREIATQDERVKAQALDSTWPILINYENVPTYFIVLKNDVQAQKVVLVNVKDGSLVAMGSSFADASNEYNKLLISSGISNTDQSLNIEGHITHLRDLGSSIEFMIDSMPDCYFVVNPSLSLDARFMKIGDYVSIDYKVYTNYNYVISFSKK